MTRITLLVALVALPNLALAERNRLMVREGQTLTELAHRYEVSVAALARLNGLNETDTLHIGQKLLLPGEVRHAAPKDVALSKGKKRKSKTPLSLSVTASFVRVATNEHDQIQLLDKKGRVTTRTRHRLAALMHPRGSNKTKLPHARLVMLVGRISQHFEGKPIHIISGYRKPGGYTSRASRHTHGRAIDFRIAGVSNTVLRDFCRRFPDVGVGYYPHSGFIHLDVRDKNAFWIDASRAGEAPRYVTKDYAKKQSERNGAADAEKDADTESDIEREDEQEPNDPAVVEPVSTTTRTRSDSITRPL